jgi:hypothetical protein
VSEPSQHIQHTSEKRERKGRKSGIGPPLDVHSFTSIISYRVAYCVCHGHA